MDYLLNSDNFQGNFGKLPFSAAKPKRRGWCKKIEKVLLQSFSAVLGTENQKFMRA